MCECETLTRRQSADRRRLATPEAAATLEHHRPQRVRSWRSPPRRVCQASMRRQPPPRECPHGRSLHREPSSRGCQSRKRGATATETRRRTWRHTRGQRRRGKGAVGCPGGGGVGSERREACRCKRGEAQAPVQRTRPEPALVGEEAEAPCAPLVAPHVRLRRKVSSEPQCERGGTRPSVRSAQVWPLHEHLVSPDGRDAEGSGVEGRGGGEKVPDDVPFEAPLLRGSVHARRGLLGCWAQSCAYGADCGGAQWQHWCHARDVDEEESRHISPCKLNVDRSAHDARDDRLPSAC